MLGRETTATTTMTATTRRHETHLVTVATESARSSRYTATSSSVVRPRRFFSDSQRLPFVAPMCTRSSATSGTIVVVVVVVVLVAPGSAMQLPCGCCWTLLVFPGSLTCRVPFFGITTSYSFGRNQIGCEIEKETNRERKRERERKKESATDRQRRD